MRGVAKQKKKKTEHFKDMNQSSKKKTLSKAAEKMDESHFSALKILHFLLRVKDYGNIAEVIVNKQCF